MISGCAWVDDADIGVGSASEPGDAANEWVGDVADDEAGLPADGVIGLRLIALRADLGARLAADPEDARVELFVLAERDIDRAEDRVALLGSVVTNEPGELSPKGGLERGKAR